MAHAPPIPLNKLTISGICVIFSTCRIERTNVRLVVAKKGGYRTRPLDTPPFGGSHKNRLRSKFHGILDIVYL